MGDVVTCKAVLVRPVDPTRSELLYLCATDDKGLRMIPVARVGAPVVSDGYPDPWRYEERGGRLHLTPSMLATDSGFHTDYSWSCDFEVCPDGMGGYEHFKTLNPNVNPQSE